VPPGTGTTDVVVKTIGGTSVKSAADQYTYASAQTKYTYNGDDLRMTQTTSAGTSGYGWDSTSSVPQLLTDSTLSYIYGPGGLPIEQVDAAGSPSYFFQDAIGSTRALLTSKGAIAATFTYSPYGSLLAVTGTATTPILFAGGYQDRSTSLYYLVHRYFEPSIGQFLTVDPAVEQSKSSYGYASGDPVNASDPSGLWPKLSPKLLKAVKRAFEGADLAKSLRELGLDCFGNQRLECASDVASTVGGFIPGYGIIITAASYVLDGVSFAAGRVIEAEARKKEAAQQAQLDAIMAQRAAQRGISALLGPVCGGPSYSSLGLRVTSVPGLAF
jgi:RHS repeat-associated protein